MRAVLDHEAIRRRIKQAREATGLSQSQLGELLNVTPKTVSNYENLRVPWEHMNQISEITGRRLRWLLHGDDWLSAEERSDIHEIREKLEKLLRHDRAGERRKSLSRDGEEKGEKVP